MSLCSISTCNVAVQFGFSPAILPCLSQNYIMTQFHFKVKKLIIRVATVREKSGKNKNFSRSGKSQGILQKVRENLSSCQSQ